MLNHSTKTNSYKKRLANILPTLLVSVNLYAEPVLVEDFDIQPNVCIRQHIAQKENITLGNYGTQDGSGIKVSYSGFSAGSTRSIFNCPLPKKDEYTLTYNVMFDSDFQFLGGKLHGLGPEKVASGGHGVAPDSWSARVLFEKDKGIGVYLYEQKQKSRFGTELRASNFKFELNKYYNIKMYVKVNSSSDMSDGKIVLLVDGEKLIEKENIKFRDVNGNEGLISKFIFSTFHGGSTPSFAPKDKNNEYTTVHAYFDNFKVE